MRRADPTARRVLGAFSGAGRAVRLHTRVRWWTCPFTAVADLMPPAGDVVDVGCGHGQFAMYLAATSPARRVLGVDIDAAKIAAGSAALRRLDLDGRVTLTTVGPRWRPDPESVDAIVVNDVLYLLGSAAAADLLADLAKALRPGGRLVVKDVGERPRWKYLVNEVQERLATGLGVTKGATVEVLTEAQLREPLEAAGLVLGIHRLDRGYAHAHLVVTADRPAAR